LACSHSQVCYVSSGVCQPSCIPTGNLPSEAAVRCDDAAAFNITVGSVCNKNTGVCYGCMTNDNCQPSLKSSCGSVCKTNSDYTQTCSSVSACSGNCVKNATSGNYDCSVPATGSSVTFGFAILFITLLATVVS
jgi:hypothetical protein